MGMGVSLEKSLSASLFQLQAGCHGNRVRGPPLQQLSCGLGEGWGPAGPSCVPVSTMPWGARAPEVAPHPLVYSPQTQTPASPVLVQALLAPVTLLWASDDPPHTPGHFLISSLSSEVRVLAVTLPHPSFHMADASPSSDTHSPPSSPGPDPQALGHHQSGLLVKQPLHILGWAGLLDGGWYLGVFLR